MMESDSHAPDVDPASPPDRVRPAGEADGREATESEPRDGHSRRRLAIYSALAGLLTGGCFLWSAPATPTIPLPAPAALKPGGVNTVVLLSLLENVRDAKPVVDEERKRAEAEREAFGRFSDRVARMDATQHPRTGGGVEQGGTVAVDVGSTDTRLRNVIEAYRETVLEVGHYEEEYDQPAAEHMAEEFGAEIASTLLRGRSFTPQLRDTLVEAGIEARQQRDALVRTLDSETDALSRAEQVMAEVEAELDGVIDGSLYRFSFDELSETWIHLRGLERRCEDLLRDRQRRIHHGHGLGFRSLDGKRLHQYVYQSLDAHYPVLADGADLVDRVKSARGRITRAISRRV